MIGRVRFQALGLVLTENWELLIQRAAAIRRWNVRLQKISHALVSVNLVFDFGKTVAFVLIYFVFDHAAALLDRIDYLLRLFLWGSADRYHPPTDTAAL